MAHVMDLRAQFPELGTPIDQETANKVLEVAWRIKARNEALRKLLHKIDVAHSESECDGEGCWYPAAEVAQELDK